MVEFIEGEAQEASTEELILFAKKEADSCNFENFAETLFRLGQRGISREIGLELIARFDKECRCHDKWDDYSDDAGDY